MINHQIIDHQIIERGEIQSLMLLETLLDTKTDEILKFNININLREYQKETLSKSIKFFQRNIVGQERWFKHDNSIQQHELHWRCTYGLHQRPK